MSNKMSRLGRGLGDLLDDNTPEVRTNRSVIRHDSIAKETDKLGSKTIVEDSTIVKSDVPTQTVSAQPAATAEKSLYEQMPRRSLKAVFRSFNKQ